jgi:hypothetical protein
MTIQFHTDNNFTATDEFTSPFIDAINHSLSRFSHQVTSIQVHLSDENGGKPGDDDKRCVLEARLEGMEPIAVTCYANNIQQAVKGSIDKLKAALDHRRDRLRTY